MLNRRARVLAAAAGGVLGAGLLVGAPAHAGTPGNLCSEPWSLGQTTNYNHNGHYDRVQYQGHNDRLGPHYHYWYNLTHGANMAPLECH